MALAYVHSTRAKIQEVTQDQFVYLEPTECRLAMEQ